MNPEQIKQERERVLTRLDYIKAHASVLDEMERYDELKVFRAASMLRETVAVIESLEAQNAALLAIHAAQQAQLAQAEGREKALREALKDVCLMHETEEIICRDLGAFQRMMNARAAFDQAGEG